MTNKVAFFNSSSTLNSDNLLHWDNTNKRLGIGTTTPAYDLSVVGRLDLRLTDIKNNIAIGSEALLNIGTDTNNIAIGSRALKSITTAGNVTAIGTNAGRNLTTARNSIIIGRNSLITATTGGGASVYIGSNSGSSVTTGGISSVVVGMLAGSGITTGSYNTLIGKDAMYTGNGSSNVAIGTAAMFNGGDGSFHNVVIGVDANGGSTNPKNGNTIIGSNSGKQSGGSYNVFLGYQSGYSESGNNRLYIENSSSATPLIGGHFDNNRVGINKAITDISSTLHVGGDTRIDNISGTATKIAGFDSNNRVVETSIGAGLALTGGTISSTITQADGSETKINAGTDISVTGSGTTGSPYVISSTVTPADGSETKINAGTNVTITGSGTTGSPYVINSTGGSGTVTSVGAGNGMNFSTITTTGDVTLGTPSSITLSSTNSVTSNSHTHAFTPGGTSSQYIRGDGVLATFPSIPPGTVTSIATNNGITGGTITSSGTVGLTGQALALHNLGTNGLIVRTGSGTVAGRTLTAGTGITITNGDGVSGNPVISATGTTQQTWYDWGSTMSNWGTTNAFNSGKWAGLGDANPTRLLDVNGDARFRGAIYSSSNSPGTSGQVLTSNGSGAWSWQTPSGGATNLSYSIKSGTDVYLESSTGADVIIRDGIGTTVNRVASNVIKIDATNTGTVTSISTNNGITGGTITSTGTVGLTGQALALHNLGTNGLITRTASGTVAARTLTAGTGISITNGNGVSGDPTIIAHAGSVGQLHNNNAYNIDPLTASEVKIDFPNGLSNGGITTNTTTDRITVNSSGLFRITYNFSYRITDAGNYLSGIQVYVKLNGTIIGQSRLYSRNAINALENDNNIAKDFIMNLNNGDYLELYIIRLGNANKIGIGYPVLNIQKIN